jgi:hypothetical protein
MATMTTDQAEELLTHRNDWVDGLDGVTVHFCDSRSKALVWIHVEGHRFDFETARAEDMEFLDFAWAIERAKSFVLHAADRRLLELP